MFSKTELIIIGGWFIGAFGLILLGLGIITLTSLIIFAVVVMVGMIVMHGGVMEFTSGFSDTEKDDETMAEDEQREYDEGGYTEDYDDGYEEEAVE